MKSVLNKREQDKNGRIREKNGASKVKNLAKDYPILAKNFRPEKTLTSIRNLYMVDSLDKVLKILDKKNGKK